MTFGRPTALPIVEFGGVDQGFATMRVTSPYGPRTGNFAGFHGGLDIGNARSGDDVVAIGAGKVIYASNQPRIPWNYPSPADKVARWGPSYGGFLVVIDHGNGIYSQYAHLEVIAIPPDSQATRGQLVGRVGATGSAIDGGAHLHFGIRDVNVVDHGGFVDPWPLIRAAAMATLPDTGTEDPMPKLTSRINGVAVRVPAATQFRKAAAFTTAPYYTSPTPQTIQPFGKVAGEPYKTSSTATATDWYVYVASDLEYGYLPAVIGDVVALDAPKDCAADVQAATDPLRARIDSLKAISTDANNRIQSG